MTDYDGLKWYSVTFRGTAEMTVTVLADSPEDAREHAEDGDYRGDDASEITWVEAKPYTMKVRRVGTPAGDQS